MPLLHQLYTLYDQVNHTEYFAIDTMAATLVLALLVRLIQPKSALRYQWVLILLGLPITLWLWAHAWANLLLLYAAWWLLVAVCSCLCTPAASMTILTVAYAAYICYARSKTSFWWDPFIYILTLQMQYMRAVDVVLAWPEIDEATNTKLLALLSYIATPLNVTTSFYGRFTDWCHHLRSPNRIPPLSQRRVLLAKRIVRVAICLALTAAQASVLSWVALHVSPRGWVVGIAHTLWFRITYWPLWNNIMFLGANALGIPGVEISDSPILATSPIDYWRRAQLGVATFFKEKVYYGKWFGRRSPYINAFLTFTLLGLWHGLCLPWAIWGVAWGLLIAANHYVETRFGPAIERASASTRFLVSLGGWAFTIFIVHVLQDIVLNNRFVGLR